MWNLRKAFSLRTIKICRFEIIDGVKYVYCIKHTYMQISSEGTSGVCGRSLTLASMCFLFILWWASCKHTPRQSRPRQFIVCHYIGGTYAIHSQENIWIRWILVWENLVGRWLSKVAIHVDIERWGLKTFLSHSCSEAVIILTWMLDTSMYMSGADPGILVGGGVDFFSKAWGFGWIWIESSWILVILGVKFYHIISPRG